MPKTKQQKHDLVAELSDKLGKSNSVVFTDYKGLTMAQLSELRSKFSELSAEYTVTKNTLLQHALKQSNISVEDKSFLEGPVATLFSFGEQIEPIKILTKGFKDFQIGEVKAGLLDGQYMSKDQVIKLSQLPSQQELRAKVVGSLGAPLYGIVGVLQANLRNLVYALDQIRISKGGE